MQRLENLQDMIFDNGHQSHKYFAQTEQPINYLSPLGHFSPGIWTNGVEKSNDEESAVDTLVEMKQPHNIS